ncbi:MAG TPA: hypothetical protein VK864_09445, partial [Longimicrobiales bacterium]|nr:hypothetical protein [Longimicrobiales bacterium]
MFPHRAVANLLGLALVSVLVSGCEDDLTTAQEVPGKPEAAARSSASRPDIAKLSDRELLVTVLDRLESLERRLGPQYDVVTAGTASTGRGRGTGSGNGQGNGQGGGPGSPGQLGVPQQLDVLAARVAVLNDKINEVIVGIGLPKPPDSGMSDSELFQTTSKVCFSVGAGVDTKLTGAGKLESKGKGGLGIDFYGNKMLVELGGHGAINGELTVAPIKAAATYSFCVDARRQEAQALIAALPFSASEFQTRMQSLAGHVQDLRTAPFSIINPNFRLFGMAEGGYPSASEMVSRIDNFFGLVKGPICSHLKSKFDIVKQLDL